MLIVWDAIADPGHQQDAAANKAKTCASQRLELYIFLFFIYSDYFYSASSSPLLLRGAPDTAQILCRSFMPKRHRQL